MSIFSPCEGGVFRVDNKCAGGENRPGVVKIENIEGAPTFTGFMLELHTNHQFLHSLDEFIYVFPFGDRVGEFTITGLTFLGSCNGGEQSKEADNGVYGYYMKKRLSTKEGFKPTKITINGDKKPLLGFLTGLRMETLRPEMPVIQWVLRYNVIIGK